MLFRVIFDTSFDPIWEFVHILQPETRAKASYFEMRRTALELATTAIASFDATRARAILESISHVCLEIFLEFPSVF